MLENLTVTVDHGPQYPTQYVLELACAAQRINKSYIREGEAVFDDQDKFLYMKNANKMMMLVTLDPRYWKGAPADMPFPMKVKPEDTALVDEIRQHYKKLMFAAVEGENEFLTTVNTILNSDVITTSKFGYAACLPSVYKRDYADTQFKKRSKTFEPGYLATIGSNLVDLDCEIIETMRSKNFDAWNISAIIDNKMVSWFSKTDLQLGACVVIKAKVKDHSTHWKHGNAVTRLNYVKAAQ